MIAYSLESPIVLVLFAILILGGSSQRFTLAPASEINRLEDKISRLPENVQLKYCFSSCLSLWGVYDVHVWVQVSLHHSPHMEVRGKLSSVVSIFSFPCGTEGSNSGCFPVWQVLLPTDHLTGLGSGVWIYRCLWDINIVFLGSWFVCLGRWVSGWVFIWDVVYLCSPG